MSQSGEENAVQSSNEVVLKRTKTMVMYEYGSVTTKASVDEGFMTLEQVSNNLLLNMFSKAKPKVQKVEYAHIGGIDMKHDFNIGAAAFGVIIWIIMLILIIGIDADFMGNAMMGAMIAMAGYLIFGTCGKKFVITKKNGTAINVFSDGDEKKTKPFLEKLAERGVNTQNIKESAIVKKMAYVFAAVSLVFIIIGSCSGNPVDALLNDFEKTVNEVVRNSEEMKRITESGGNVSREELLARANVPYQRMQRGIERLGEIGGKLDKHENNMSLQQKDRLMKAIQKMNSINR
jgi:hypothetical protein